MNPALLEKLQGLADCSTPQSLDNYYFRSKEKLFHLTFEEMFRQHFANMLRTLNQKGLTLKERITLRSCLS